MSIVSDVLDAAVEISTSSAEAVTTKWPIIVVSVVGIAALLLIALLLVFAPMAGLALLIAILAVLYILSQGDNNLV